MKLHIFASLLLFQQIYALPPKLQGCNMTPVSKREFDGKIATISDARYKDGIVATNIADAIRHEKCDNGACKWIFHACHTDSNYNAMTFALESKKYRNTFMYANVATGMSHYTQSLDKICTISKRYEWILYYADCTDSYFLFNLSYADWLDASDLGLVKHSKCSNNPYSTDSSCAYYRELKFEDVQDFEG